MNWKKKGVLGLESVVKGLVVIGFILIIGFAMMEKGQDTQTANSYGYNGSTTVLQAIDDIPAWLGVIVIAFIGAGLFLLLRRFG